ncbi:MAG TPA: hypothetical protein VJ932_08650, partial [Alkalispirochaeta sp.]|nr:hypothetical protein [Alkalispirochaeta sp.]
PPDVAGAGLSVTGGSPSLSVTKFPLSTIRGIQVQYTRQLEFYANGILHVLRTTGTHDSAARVEATILAAQDLYKAAKH